MVAADALDKTILYTTDHSLDPELMAICRRWLVRNGCGCPIISATMRPDDFGENVCVGELPRSGISLDIQLLAGAKRVRTKWLMLAEHDCLYSEEHVRWIPPNEEEFFYNDNNWLLQWQNDRYPEYDGMFSYRRHRMVQSQLVCSTARYVQAMEDKVRIVTHPDWQATYPTGRVAEPGACDREKSLQISSHRAVAHLQPALIAYMDEYRGVEFKTREPNVDIRHGTNFTGHRRGNFRCWDLPPWGTKEAIAHA